MIRSPRERERRERERDRVEDNDLAHYAISNTNNKNVIKDEDDCHHSQWRRRRPEEKSDIINLHINRNISKRKITSGRQKQPKKIQRRNKTKGTSTKCSN